MGKEYRDRDERVRYLWRQIRLIYIVNSFVARLKNSVAVTY